MIQTGRAAADHSRLRPIGQPANLISIKRVQSSNKRPLGPTRPLVGPINQRPGAPQPTVEGQPRQLRFAAATLDEESDDGEGGWADGRLRNDGPVIYSVDAVGIELITALQRAALAAQWKTTATRIGREATRTRKDRYRRAVAAPPTSPYAPQSGHGRRRLDRFQAYARVHSSTYERPVAPPIATGG